MNSSTESQRGSAQRQASHWAARLDRPGLEPDESRALEAWLGEDPSHRVLLAEYCQLSADAERWLPLAYPHGAGLPAARPRPRQAWRWAAGLAAALTVGIFTWSVWTAGDHVQLIATLPAQRHTVRLADGTQADLNARTTAAVEFLAHERRMELRSGEVLLRVAKDAARPFVLTTPLGVVTVTGTQFDVRLAGPDTLEVTVLEGSVRVRADGAGAVEHALQAGDQLELKGREATVRRLSAATVADVAAWREGTLAFEHATVAEVVRRYADYHGRTVEVDPAVAGLTLGGRFSLDEWDAFFAALERVVAVRIEQGSTGVKVLPAGHGR